MSVEELRRWRLVEWASATDACRFNGRIQVQRDVLSVEGGGRCSGAGAAASARRKEEGGRGRSGGALLPDEVNALLRPSLSSSSFLLFSSIASLIPVDRLVQRLWAGCSTPLSTRRVAAASGPAGQVRPALRCTTRDCARREKNVHGGMEEMGGSRGAVRLAGG